MDRMLSTIPKQSVFGFGTSTRNQAKKLFTHEVEKDFTGQHSPGPKYLPPIRQNQSYSFSHAERADLVQKISYQTKVDDMRLTRADKFRKPRSPIIRIGLSERFAEKQIEQPPMYLPLHQNTTPQYSFGLRLSDVQVLKTHGSPPEIGPGLYPIQSRDNSPKWSFPKTELVPLRENKQHETYYNGKALGNQVLSTKRTLPSYSQGKSARQAPNLLKEYQKKISVRIPHKY